MSSFSNTLQQVNEVIQEQAGEAVDMETGKRNNNVKMPNIMIDQIDSKMLDTIVSTIHTKKANVPETSSGSFQPLIPAKQNEMLIVINEQNE